MFVPLFEDGDVNTYEFGSMYRNHYSLSTDLKEVSRYILLHNDLNGALIDGVKDTVVVKCTIINLSVVSGIHNYDTYSNPEEVLIKSVYNGRITVPKNSIKKGVKIKDEVLVESEFFVNNAFCSIISGWWGNSYSGLEMYSPMGITMMDTLDLRHFNRQRRNITLHGDGKHSVMYDISFDDGNSYSQILPIPRPSFYSSNHATFNGYEPIMNDVDPIKFLDLCDEYTKVSTVDIGVGMDLTKDPECDTESMACIEYYDGSRCKLEPFYETEYGKSPPILAFSSARDRFDTLSKIVFKTFNRNQLKAATFVYNGHKEMLEVTELLFSYDVVPDSLIESVINELVNDSQLHMTMGDIKILFTNDYKSSVDKRAPNLIFRMTDIKCDIRLLLNEPFNECPDVSYLHYRSSIYDLLMGASGMETSIMSPIQMI